MRHSTTGDTKVDDLWQVYKLSSRTTRQHLCMSRLNFVSKKAMTEPHWSRVEKSINPFRGQINVFRKQITLSKKYFYFFGWNRIRYHRFQWLNRLNCRRAAERVPEGANSLRLESTVFLFTLAVLENHEIFSSRFSEDDSGIELKHCKSSRITFRRRKNISST